MRVSIFDYKDPGDFLKEGYRALKEAEPGVSHRYIAASLGFKSPSIFYQIMAGRIDPSPRTVDGLARILGLDGEQRDFLALLFMLRKFRHEKVREGILNGYFSGRGNPGSRSATAEL